MSYCNCEENIFIFEELINATMKVNNTFFYFYYFFKSPAGL